MRDDLSRRSRYFDKLKRQKWWSFSRAAAPTPHGAGLSEASTDASDGALAETVGGTAGGGDGDRVEELSRKVQALEAQLSLLTVGMLRNQQSAGPGTFEDICGTGLRTEACLPESQKA